MKSQILAGGRGLGKFTNGFQGGVHIVKVEDAEDTAKKMLGQTLVTKQTGPAGKPVNTLYLASKMDLVNEMYFAILLDRETAGPMLIGCSEGMNFFHYQDFLLVHQHANVSSSDRKMNRFKSQERQESLRLK